MVYSGFRLVTPSRCVGAGRHHSGWPWLLAYLRENQDTRGILLDDFVDRTLVYPGSQRPKEFPYDEPFVGIFHHSDDCPEWLTPFHNRTLGNELRLKRWSMIKDHLRGAITLSRHASRQLRNYTDKPIAILSHPIAAATGVWNFSEWRSDRRVVQIGWYGRNIRAIFQMPPKYGYRYVRLRAKLNRYKDCDLVTRKHYADVRNSFTGVVDRKAVPVPEYEQILRTSVIMMEVLSGSANNVVLECIVRNTPLLVNRYPAVEDYLGKDYPLYFDDPRHAETLLTDERIYAASDYLSRLSKKPFTAEYFLSQLNQFIRIL